MDRTCCRCDAGVWVYYAAKPYCREHYLEQAQRPPEDDADTRAAAATAADMGR